MCRVRTLMAECVSNYSAQFHIQHAYLLDAYTELSVYTHTQANCSKCSSSQYTYVCAQCVHLGEDTYTNTHNSVNVVQYIHSAYT